MRLMRGIAFVCCLLLVLVLRFLFPGSARAQSGCPTLTSYVTNGIKALGLDPDANVSVVVLDTSNGDFDANEVQQVTDAISGIAAIPNSNVDFTVENTDEPPNLSQGTSTHPINLVEIGTQQQINSLCPQTPGVAACTSFSTNGAGHTTSSTTILLAAAVASSVFEQLQSHEFGHADLGFQDCVGCSNTIMNPDITSDSPTAPTSCDDSSASKNCL